MTFKFYRKMHNYIDLRAFRARESPPEANTPMARLPLTTARLKLIIVKQEADGFVFY